LRASGCSSRSKPENQIFLSASRAQANIFRAYIVQWVQKVCGVSLKGDPIAIQRGEGRTAPARPVELSLWAPTAPHETIGDVSDRRCFWIYGFEAVQGRLRDGDPQIYTRTLFSTPSTLAHGAYPMWSGDRFNRRRARGEQGASRSTMTCSGMARWGPTASGARSSPCSTPSPRASTSSISRNCNAKMVDEFDNLFRCLFLDDSQSMFPFEIMRRCMVDSWDVWRDVQPYAAQPYAGEVWLGYDPNASEAGTGDDAALVAIAAPLAPGALPCWKKRLKGLSSTSRPPRSARWPGAIASPASPST
jgi:hypothetical protein